MNVAIAVTRGASFDENGKELREPARNKPVIHDLDLKHSFSVFRKLATVVLFYLLASLYYHDVEGWSTTDCIYYLTVTISTVGYGDYHPTTDDSRMFTIFMLLIGLIFIFAIINDVAKFFLDLAEEQAARVAKQKEVVAIDPFKYWRKRGYTALVVVILLFVGTTVMYTQEDWTIIQSIYFCVVTTTTVGYGDLEPTNTNSKIFLIFYIPISVCVVAGALGSIAAIQIEMEADRKKLKALTRRLDFKMIREMDVDGNGVDKCEFLVAMLVQSGICDKENDIDPWLARFDELDKDGSGMLDEDDISIMEREESERLNQLYSLQGMSDLGSVLRGIGQPNEGGFAGHRPSYQSYRSANDRFMDFLNNITAVVRGSSFNGDPVARRGFQAHAAAGSRNNSFSGSPAGNGTGTGSNPGSTHGGSGRNSPVRSPEGSFGVNDQNNKSSLYSAGGNTVISDLTSSTTQNPLAADGRASKDIDL